MSIVKYCELYNEIFADAKATGVVDPFPCAVDAVVEQAKADERARLAGEGPTDAECLSIADQISARWVKEHPRGATHNDRPLDKLIVRAVANLAAAHAAARYEARVVELEAAARALPEALPRCDEPLCGQRASWVYAAGDGVACDDHRHAGIPSQWDRIDYADEAAALERLVTK